MSGRRYNLRQRATDIAAAVADEVNNFIDGETDGELDGDVGEVDNDGDTTPTFSISTTTNDTNTGTTTPNDPTTSTTLNLSDVDSDVEDVDSDGVSTPTTTTTTTTNTTTTTYPFTMPDGAVANPHTTTTVHNEKIFVSEFSTNSQTEMRQFFKTFRLSLKIKYTSPHTGVLTKVELDLKCVAEWRGHVKTDNVEARALTNLLADVTDWDLIVSTCLNSVRGSSATDARRATMTFYRTKLPVSSHIVMVYHCKELIDNFLEAVTADTDYVETGEDSIKISKLRTLLMGSLTTCHMHTKAQPDYLKKGTSSDTVVQFIENTRDVTDIHNLTLSTELELLNRDGTPYISQTVGSVSTDKKGNKPAGNKATSSKSDTKPADTGTKSDTKAKPDKTKNRWVATQNSDNIPPDRCFNCTQKGHRAAECESKAWCPKHKCPGHRWSDCKARKTPATATSTA